MSQKTYFIVVGGLGLFFALLLFFLTRRSGSNIPPQILTTTPTEGASSASVFLPLSLQFDTPVDPMDFSVESSPTENWTIDTLSPTQLKLEHKEFFRVNTQYTIKLNYQGKELAKLHFKTAAEQNDPRYLQTVEDELNRDYPLRINLPLETADYRVVYSAPLELEITMKTGDMSDNVAIEEVKKWVSQNGGSASAHQYVVVPFSQ